jgi:hypothetical protein
MDYYLRATKEEEKRKQNFLLYAAELFYAE